MVSFVCPVCGSELFKNGESLFCENRHNFDIASAGYVNLLLNNRSKLKQHGDDKMMARARRDFLTVVIMAGFLKV